MDLPRLMLVTDRSRTRGRELLPLVVEAARAGVGLVQLREKEVAGRELAALARAFREALPKPTLLVINGQPRLAARLGAGLHLPADAAPLAQADRPAGPFGRSVHDLAQTARALEDRPDYLIFGHVFATPSKPGRAPAGPSALAVICRRAHPVPVFAIGGITVSRIPTVLHAGAWGVALSGTILGASDPPRVTRALALALTVTARAQADVSRG